jgi:hypothetical protein
VTLIRGTGPNGRPMSGVTAKRRFPSLIAVLDEAPSRASSLPIRPPVPVSAGPAAIALAVRNESTDLAAPLAMAAAVGHAGRPVLRRLGGVRVQRQRARRGGPPGPGSRRASLPATGPRPLTRAPRSQFYGPGNRATMTVTLTIPSVSPLGT